MPPADPSLTLFNPYAGGEPDTPSGRSARAAGRVLAVGALGLGAVAAFTGTAAADEADDASDRSSEVADSPADEESSDDDGQDAGTDDGQDAGTDDAPDGADDEAQDSSDSSEADADSDASSDADPESTSADADSSAPAVVEEEPEGGSDPQDGAGPQPASDTPDDEPTGADGDDDAERGSGGGPVPADAPAPSDADDSDERSEEDGDEVAAEVLVASAGTPEPGASDSAERSEEDGDEVLVTSADTPEPRAPEADEPGSEAEPARFDTGAADGFRIDEDAPLPPFDAEDLGFAPGPALEEFTGGDGDPFGDADRLADLFGNGTVEIEGLGTVDIAPLTERLRDVEVRDESGTSVRIGDVVDRFRPDAPAAQELPTVRLPQDVRDAIDARRTQEAAGTDARVDATVGTPRSVQVAPGVTVTGPRVDTGSARFDLDLDEGRIGVTGLGSDLGRVTVQGSGTTPLDGRGGSRVQGTTSTTVTLDPQTGRSAYLAGSPATGDPADAPERLTVQTTNLGTLSTGTLPPSAQPTGDRTARWDALGASAGLNGTLALANGEDSVGASGTAATPLSVFARAGEDDPGSRWNADLTGTLTPQVVFGPTGSDTQTTTSVTGRVGGEIGDRRNTAGDFAGDTDGDGRGAGAVVSGGLSGQYTATDSGLLTVPGTTRRVDADTTGYRAGGDLGFELREDQPRFEAGIEGTVAAGVQGSSVETAIGSSATGPSPFVNARLAGDVEVATAPRGQDRAYARVDGSARYDLANGRSSSSAQITPRVGGEIGLGGTTTLGGSVGYQLGVTDDATNGTRNDSGPVAGVSTGFNAFGGRGDVGLTYDGADPAGGESVAVKVGFTPGASRETPRPAADPVPIPTPGDLPQFAADGATLGLADSSVLTPLPGAQGVAVAPVVTPAVPGTGPLVDDASALAGTTPVGIDLVPAPVADPGAPGGDAALDVSLNQPVVDIPVVQPDPVVVTPVDPGGPAGAAALDVSLNDPGVDIPVVQPDPVVVAPVVQPDPVAVAPVGLGGSAGDEALNISLTEPVVDVPVVQPDPVAVAPVVSPMEVASVDLTPAPLVDAQPVPDLVPSPAFSMDAVAGFDPSVSIPMDTSFSVPDTSFLDTGSFGFSGGGSFF